MKKKLKKLQLAKETIVHLSGLEVGKVVGGSIPCITCDFGGGCTSGEPKSLLCNSNEVACVDPGPP